MPTQPARGMRGNRSNRSPKGIVSRRLVAALAVALLVTLIPAAPARAAYVYLDPGHGGRYPGAVYGGVSEAYVNLLISLDVRAALQARGHRVGMTRTSNTTVGSTPRPAWHWDSDGVHLRPCDSACRHDAPVADLQARVDKANSAGADIFISIHNNAASSSARGTETYHPGDSKTDLELSRRLARYVQDGIVTNVGTTDRGIHQVGFYVVRWSNMPAILVEVAFLSNSSDRALLLSSAFRRNVAAGIATGVDRFLASDPFKPLYPRIAGEDRFATAAEVASEGWPDGADTVFLASGLTWPDSLAATPLAVAQGAPILLSAPTYLPPATRDALARIAPERIVLLGGVKSLSSIVATRAAAAAGIPVRRVSRIAGDDRYGTAVEIADAVGIPDSGSVFVVSGADFPDALSASAHAGRRSMPVLMTSAGRLPSRTAAFLRDHAADIDRVFIMGGTPTISDAVSQQIATEAQAQVTRVSGPSRYETNLEAIRTFWSRASDISPYVSKATDFPDALVSGVLAARDREPIMLVGTRYLPGETREFLMNDASRISSFTVVGGNSAVSVLMEWQLVKAMRLED